MIKLYRRIPKSQSWYLGQSLNWLVYVLMAIFFISNKSIHFSFRQTLQFIRGNSPNIYFPDCKEQDESHPHFIFHHKLFLKLHYISKLVNLNYFFKISLKAMIIGTTFQFHNGISLKIVLSWFSLFSNKCFSGILLREILLWRWIWPNKWTVKF